MTESDLQNSHVTQRPGRDLTGKVAWITGAGTGMGQAAAVSLARAGMQLVLSGRRASKLEETADLVREVGAEAVIEALDITDPEAVAQVIARIEERFGGLDTAVLSAGINIKNRSWKDVDAAGWDSVINIDLNGAFYCCQAILPILRRQKSGLIINVASWAGVRVSTLSGPAYSAAKHAMVAMSESINMEESKHGIRCCALCPGEVATPLLDQRPVPITEEQKAVMVQSEDIGETVLFLAGLPERVCINQLIISPTANRAYAG